MPFEQLIYIHSLLIDMDIYLKVYPICTCAQDFSISWTPSSSSMTGRFALIILVERGPHDTRRAGEEDGVRYGWVVEVDVVCVVCVDK